MNIYKLNLLFLSFLSISAFAMDEKKKATIGLFTAIQRFCSLDQAKIMIENPDVDLNLGVPFTSRLHNIPHTFFDCLHGFKRIDIAQYLLNQKKINPFIPAGSEMDSSGIKILLNKQDTFYPLITNYIEKNIDKETGVVVIKDLIDYGDSSAVTTVLENIHDPLLKFNIVNSSDKNGNPLISVAVNKYIRMKTQRKPERQEEAKDIINNLIKSGAQFDKLNPLVKDQAPELLPLFNKDTSMPDATAQ